MVEMQMYAKMLGLDGCGRQDDAKRFQAIVDTIGGDPTTWGEDKIKRFNCLVGGNDSSMLALMACCGKDGGKAGDMKSLMMLQSLGGCLDSSTLMLLMMCGGKLC